MRFLSQPPPPPLGEFIHHFWNSTYAPSHPQVRILPRGTVELVINLSEDEIRIYDSAQSTNCLRFPGIVLSGAYTAALDLDPMQHASILGVHFRPGGAFPFFGAAVGELVNRHVALENLWGTAANELRERLCAAATPQQRFQILANALESRLRRDSAHPAVALALGIWGPAGIGDTVEAVANRVGLSQRRFIQVFTAQVGLTPKRFSRVLRLQHARAMVRQSATPNWSQVAHGCGYYDQSHLIRDFQELARLSPTDYLRLSGNNAVPHMLPLLD